MKKTFIIVALGFSLGSCSPSVGNSVLTGKVQPFGNEKLVEVGHYDGGANRKASQFLTTAYSTVFISAGPTDSGDVVVHDLSTNQNVQFPKVGDYQHNNDLGSDEGQTYFGLLVSNDSPEVIIQGKGDAKIFNFEGQQSESEAISKKLIFRRVLFFDQNYIVLGETKASPTELEVIERKAATAKKIPSGLLKSDVSKTHYILDHIGTGETTIYDRQLNPVATYFNAHSVATAGVRGEPVVGVTYEANAKKYFIRTLDLRTFELPLGWNSTYALKTQNLLLSQSADQAIFTIFNLLDGSYVRRAGGYKADANWNNLLAAHGTQTSIFNLSTLTEKTWNHNIVGVINDGRYFIERKTYPKEMVLLNANGDKIQTLQNFSWNDSSYLFGNLFIDSYRLVAPGRVDINLSKAGYALVTSADEHYLGVADYDTGRIIFYEYFK